MDVTASRLSRTQYRFPPQARNLCLLATLQAVVLVAGTTLTVRQLWQHPPLFSAVELIGSPSALAIGIFLFLHLPAHEAMHLLVCRGLGGRIVNYGLHTGFLGAPRPFVEAAFPRGWTGVSTCHLLTATAGPLFDLIAQATAFEMSALPMASPWQADLRYYSVLGFAAFVVNANPLRATDARVAVRSASTSLAHAGHDSAALGLEALVVTLYVTCIFAMCLFRLPSSLRSL